MSGYFNLELRSDQMPTAARHTINRPYKGAMSFDLRAPDAEGVIRVFARSESEARDHLMNALYDMIFRSARFRLAVANPPCPDCGAGSQRNGRNSSGKRTWQCKNSECRRHFVLDRIWRGGLNHPTTQSKKPAFVRLLLSGVTVAEAADRLKLSHSTAGNWAEHVADNNPDAVARMKCPCGRPIRHRGSCEFRLRKHLQSKKIASGRAA